MDNDYPTPIDTEAMQHAEADIAERFEALGDMLNSVVEGLEARGDAFLYPHSQLQDLFDARESLTDVRDRLQKLAQEVTNTIDQVYNSLAHDPECGFVYADDDGEYHCIGDYPDDHPDAYDETRAMSASIPHSGNPFSVLGAQDTWGKVVIRFHNGSSACVVCGDTDAQRRQVVSSNLVPAPIASLPTNHQPLCNTCALRWAGMPTEAHYLAAAILLRGCPVGVESLSPNGQIGVATSDIHQRDGGTCRVCGHANPDPNAFHRGHIVSRHDARERTDGAVWGLPFVLSESPLNYVLMCPPCNEEIGPASPSLRVGLRFLMKPWTADPAAVSIIEARRAEGLRRVAERRAELQRRLRDQ